MDIEQMRIRMGEMAAEVERMQSIVDAQQSPAVAVQICDECDIAGCKHVRNQTLQITASASPRITEQDAREIINSAINFMYETGSQHPIGYWLHEEGRALLAKLNDKSELELLC